MSDGVDAARREVHDKKLLDVSELDRPPTEDGATVVEEVDEEGKTGVEEEIDSDSPHRPYNPDDIRVDPKPFSLKQILDEVAEGGIDLAPDFQRNRVWSEKQRVRLVESVLLRIPLPAFYFSADRQGRLSVVDGVQRLSTIQLFVAGEFPLTSKALEYLKVEALKQFPGKGHVDKVNFEELDPQWRRRLNQTQITANVIDPQTPEQVKFDIFKRINTGGSPLNAQEIRHSMMRERSRGFVKELTQLDAFKKVTPTQLVNHRRMADREVVLRYLSFVLLGDIGGYSGDQTMDAFLMDVAREIDDEKKISDERLNSLRCDFVRAMENALAVFGDRAFRKWPVDTTRLFPFNKALFESWAFALRKADPLSVTSKAGQIADRARAALADQTYVDSITVATGDVKSVRRRFEVATSIVQAALS
jgi:Protein of unknown function DUF262